MKEAKRAWWRVPVFCVLAGQVCFRLELALGRRFAIIRLSDGSVSVNNERWLLISAALFAATVLAGGLLFFRKRTRGELLFSAGVMFVLCAVWGLAAQLTQIGWLSIGYSESMAWCDVISQLLYRWNVNQWASAIVFWRRRSCLFHSAEGRKRQRNRQRRLRLKIPEKILIEKNHPGTIRAGAILLIAPNTDKKDPNAQHSCPFCILR